MTDYAKIAAPYIADMRSPDKGYTIIKGAFSKEEAAEMCERVKKLETAADNIDESIVTTTNKNHDWLYNLQNKDAFFIKKFFSEPILREVLKDTLNDVWYKQIPQDKPNYIMRSFSARSTGKSPLMMHVDSAITSPGETAWAVVVIALLEDMDEGNGCTVVVPGSHRSDEYAPQDAFDYATKLTAKAGDIVVIDARLWHGTIPNHSDRTRWAVIAGVGRWWVKQIWDVTGTMPDAIYQQLNDEEKSIMGFCSRPSRSENERIDPKGGYELLPDKLDS